MPAGVHHRPVAKRIRKFAKSMRHVPTASELTMWQLLRDRRLSGVKFRRQVPFDKYILDFVCLARNLVIEIDGSQHFESVRDRARDLAIERAGYRVVRYWSNDVLLRPASVLEDILVRLDGDKD